MMVVTAGNGRYLSIHTLVCYDFLPNRGYLQSHLQRRPRPKLKRFRRCSLPRPFPVLPASPISLNIYVITISARIEAASTSTESAWRRWVVPRILIPPRTPAFALRCIGFVRGSGSTTKLREPTTLSESSSKTAITDFNLFGVTICRFLLRASRAGSAAPVRTRGTH